ncbi:sigma-70 family RNA polymerase sigma factor [Bradyrhizobium sp.]|uniref:RNA polymerase sigma factor n=1 Tax=Bradyrhizobium sp. TaxID=376 RepID=UPI0025C09363|nr:sigma-70 family RNA polymerase sigma factor [Bradyrhizobium sp.]
MSDMSTLLEQQIPALRRYALGLSRDDHTADDLVQDCLERAISRWFLRRQGGDLRAWLFAILRNLYISSCRTQSRRATSMAIEEIIASDGYPDPEARLETRDILVALDQLPEEQKSILLLVGVEDFTYEDVARMLGVPIGTVMSRLSRGRQRLRTILGTGQPTLIRRVK